MPQKWASLQLDVQRVDHPRHQRQLLGRADRAADADRIVRRRLLPGVNVFQRLGAVELFERVVDRHREAVARELQQIAGREPGRIGQQLRVERRVVPPSGATLLIGRAIGSA